MVKEIADVAGSGQKDQLRRQLQKELESIAAGLHRKTEALSIEVDQYGACAECGARIPQKRLLAVPDAATCVACQDRLEHYEAQMNRELAGRGVLP